jgi:pimeloyl-ACP methyl ester carboxylesterase
VNKPSTLLPRGCPPFSRTNSSLPGYCWSTNPTKRGFNLGKIGETFNKLMMALGYSSYVAQGGDWGSIICRRMAQLYPDHCKAIHLNMLFTIGTPRFTQGPLIWLKWVTLAGPILFYDKREITALKQFQKFRKEESGYQVPSVQ